MIRGNKRMMAQKVEAKMHCSLHNRFDFEVIDSITGEIKQKAQAENIILNQLWARLLSPNTYFNYIFYGTGSGTPAATDTQLFTHLGYKAVTTPTYDYHWDEGYISLRRQCQLSETEHVGSTLSEVGIGWGTSTSNLVTHAMLKDMNGNPITIEKTATDLINIFATVFVHWDVDGYDGGSIKIYHSNWNRFILDYLLPGSSSPRLLVADYLCGGICAVYTGTYHTLNGYYFDSTATASYSVANKQITINAVRVPVASGNISNGIGSILLGHGYGATNAGIILKVGGSWYPGTSITGEAIGTGDGVTTNFKTKFSFLTGSPKIYVDGIEQMTGVSVDLDVPVDVDQMGAFFELLPLLSDTAKNNPIMDGTPDDENKASVYYNPYWQYGIKSEYSSTIDVYVSDDLETWTQVNGDIAVENRYKKYWKLVGNDSYYSHCYDFRAADLTGYNIHFDTPPAVGAVITADYTTKTIAKDVNHVFDFSLTITLAEKTT